MNYKDIKINYYYIYDDPLDDQSYLVYVIGRDAFSGNLVFSSNEWLNKVDLIDEEDAQYMKAF